MNLPYGQPLDAPVFYSLEITNSCNGVCIGCSNVFAHYGEEPPLHAAQWLAILDNIGPWAKRIKLTGGEPTLHPEFEHIVRGIQSHQIPFSVFTNGLWIHPEQLARFLATIPTCSGVLVSLHGASPSVHAGFSGTGDTFDQVVNNIRLAVSVGLAVSISTVITKSNHDRLGDVVVLAERLGVDHIAFNRYIGARSDVEPDAQQMRIAIHDIEVMLSRNKRVGYGVCIPPCFVPNQSHGCSAGIAYGAIDPWGRVRPCNHALFATEQSLLETTIHTLWQSKVLQQWRKNLTAGCEGCVALPTCHGGCAAQKQIYDLQQDPLAATWLSEATWPRPRLTLPAAAWVMPKYEVIERGESLNLVSENGIVALSTATRHLLETVERCSLEEISNNLGDEAVDFVGYLYTRGMVDLVDPSSGGTNQ